MREHLLPNRALPVAKNKANITFTPICTIFPAMFRVLFLSNEAWVVTEIFRHKGCKFRRRAEIAKNCQVSSDSQKQKFPTDLEGGKCFQREAGGPTSLLAPHLQKSLPCYCRSFCFTTGCSQGRIDDDGKGS